MKSEEILFSNCNKIRPTQALKSFLEGGDIGLFIALVPIVLNNIFLLVDLTTLETLNWILICWFIKLIVQTLFINVFINRRGRLKFNKKFPELLSQWIIKSYYKTLGTIIIICIMSPPSLVYCWTYLNSNILKRVLKEFI